MADMVDSDLLLAIQLQQQFDSEVDSSSPPAHGYKRRRLEGAAVPLQQPESPLSIVDESWETVDPSPDVRAMFLQFNHRFFSGKLSGVEVKWSPRMTLCAGVCSYEGRGGLCSIRLSEPLLKLRPRRDLVQTLLHEMIHALLFVTQNNRDRDGHGPEFCKHMERINKASGTKITVYHSFHDEVDLYRQHWWRCDGPCQNRRPYFGYVKRAMNRAPSSQDPWWGDHQRTCGGTYTKVKEPEGYGKKAKKDTRKVAKEDGKALTKASTHTSGPGYQAVQSIIPFSGTGFLLGGTSQQPPSSFPSLTPPSSLVCKSSSPSSSLSGHPQACPPLGCGDQPSSSPRVSTSRQKKRSVGNTRAFISINGSPMKAPKPSSSSRNNSILQLFNRALSRPLIPHTHSPHSSVGPPSSADKPLGSAAEASRHRRAPGLGEGPHGALGRGEGPHGALGRGEGPHGALGRGEGSRGAPGRGEGPQGAPGRGEGPRGAPGRGEGPAGGSAKKRQRDDSAATILNFFNNSSSSSSAASSIRTNSSAAEQQPAVSSSSSSSSSSSCSSSSSSVQMVRCPVCQTRVEESRINQHLDSCLS